MKRKKNNRFLLESYIKKEEKKDMKNKRREEKEWKFVYNFILEELEEYREACEQGDIIGILDALCDITYVSLGNGTMLHGLKDKIWPAYQEVQRSNLSKACTSEEEAKQTVEQRSKEQGEPCHYERIGGRYIVYRSSDKKVMKSINYTKPDLKQFFPTYKPYGYK